MDSQPPDASWLAQWGAEIAAAAAAATLALQKSVQAWNKSRTVTGTPGTWVSEGNL